VHLSGASSVPELVGERLGMRYDPGKVRTAHHQRKERRSFGEEEGGIFLERRIRGIILGITSKGLYVMNMASSIKPLCRTGYSMGRKKEVIEASFSTPRDDGVFYSSKFRVIKNHQKR